ncbi:hypothetical protein QYE76_004999 [Lolium multiflorum]|uniref:Transposase (putative) gypsy type domain-containing protein n=1 Tax=Lolium multiflorum TaxID=4521 RepID=A0AAD8RT58_LOLMU|nr:hypothetical protein QYE76_018054 [Lolium multiflorum]KAK1630684.1 hypothetical protein QYE76_004999 [Lolium multiflorum]
MGNKKGTAGSSATSGATKVGRDWSASTISKREENKLRSLGPISSAKSEYLHPGSSSRPRPPKGFIVMFAAFLFRRLSLPAHEFLRSLLFFYAIQLWQLTPNSILHLSIFITLCEAFLGIDPHWGLWRKIFYGKRHNGNDDPPVVGGVGFVVRKEVNYFDYPMKEPVQGWRQKWFYLRDIPVPASAVSQCYPPTPKSGIAPEDDDASEETEDEQHVFEDSDVQLDEAPEDDAFTKSMRRMKINEDLIATAESSPSGQDDDPDATAPPAPSRDASTPQPLKRASTLFADEDDIESISSEDDDEIPLSKRAKILNEKAESAKESNHSSAEPILPPRTTVVKVPLSTVNPSASASVPPVSRDHPIFAIVDAVADFAEQFTRLESENIQLRRAVKASADQVLEANKLAAEVQGENACLKEELRKLKKKMNDDQEAQQKAFMEDDENEGALRESIENLLNTVDMPIDRRSKLQVNSMSDALSFATESSNQLQDLLKKTKGALSKLFPMMFPKLDQNNTLEEMAETFFIDSSEAIEVLKQRSCLYEAFLTFQLLMGHGLGSELGNLSKALPVDAENCLVNLEPFKQSSVVCANRLLKLVDEDKNKTVSEAGPGSSAQA